MKKILLSTAGVLALGLAAALYLSGAGNSSPRPSTEAQGEPIVAVSLPATLSPPAQMGQTAFNAVCAACHGENGTGRNGMGPPLVHKIYESGHHGDMAFLMAVERGVPAHHWPFGDMPPQSGLTKGDVRNIVAYVRELQRANGIN